MYYSVMAKRSVVAERIEELLRIKKMSPADLARDSGVSESALSNILSGARKQPRSDTVQKIAKGFPTSTDYLNGYTDVWEPSDAPPLPEYAAEVIASMRKLDRGRNYELLLIAQKFVEANEEIRRMTRREIVDLMLDLGDEIGSKEDTDKLVDLLQRLEEKWQGNDNNEKDDPKGEGNDDDLPPLLPGDKPS